MKAPSKEEFPAGCVFEMLLVIGTGAASALGKAGIPRQARGSHGSHVCVCVCGGHCLFSSEDKVSRYGPSVSRGLSTSTTVIES